MGRSWFTAILDARLHHLNFRSAFAFECCPTLRRYGPCYPKGLEIWTGAASRCPYRTIAYLPNRTVHRSSCLSLGPHPGGSKLAFCPPAIGMEAQHSAIKMDKKTIMRGRWLSQIPVTTNANIRSAGACWKLLVLGCSAVGILRHPHSRPQCRVEMPPLNSVQQARVL